MPVPSHNLNCNTRAYQILCSPCNELVWYFSCNCGSKVFFNELGYPWEIHYCKEYSVERELEMIVDLEKMTRDEIFKFIVKQEKLRGEQIDDKIWDVIDAVLGKRTGSMSIKTVEPEKGLTEVSGKVMELNKAVNLVTRLGYERNNPMSEKLLGKFAKERWAIARVRSNPDRRNECLQFSIFMTHEYLKRYPIQQGCFIVGIAEAVAHAKGFFWRLLKHETYG